MPFLSYAQNFEDVLLWRALRHEENGFYVDVGAAHPDQDSVTRAFHDRGWRGINIEPVPEFAALLAAARPRDVNLQVAVGREEGRTTLYVVPETGLSTTRSHVMRQTASAGFDHRETTVPLRTLTGLLAEHAPPIIHFLKVDVEGSEPDVLAGCDFGLFRPWIVLVEATAPMSTVEMHAAWEPILTGANYRHVFFDGLNRYYVAEERFDRLAPHFRVPVNVFDDFRRAPEQHSQGEDRAAALAAVSARAAVAEASARAAFARAFELARDLAEARRSAATAIRDRDDRIAGMAADAEALSARGAALERDAALAQHLVWSMRASTSWRASLPLRLLGSGLRQLTGRDGAEVSAAGEGAAAAPVLADAPPAAEPASPIEPVERIRASGLPPRGTGRPARGASPSDRPLTTVHQFHSGSASGDAITGSMLLVRRLLRGMGYRSEIFVEHRDPRLADDLRLLEEMPRHADHVLIVHHSMGHDALGRVLASAAPKVLMFHNITPPEFLAGSPHMQAYARIGRRQLETLRPHVVAALAASEYNAIELRGLGYAPVRACTLLFDLEKMERRAATAPRRRDGAPCTVLFTGRVVESKAQAELVEAYARFRADMEGPCQLILVGRTDGAGTTLSDIDAAMRRHGLEAELVVTGLVSEEEVHARFAEADLFVCLSHHEGFGVPLVEAIAYDIPVLAWPSGAVPYTLGEGRGLLGSRDPPTRMAGRPPSPRERGLRHAAFHRRDRPLPRDRMRGRRGGRHRMAHRLPPRGGVPLPAGGLHRRRAAHAGIQGELQRVHARRAGSGAARGGDAAADLRRGRRRRPACGRHGSGRARRGARHGPAGGFARDARRGPSVGRRSILVRGRAEVPGNAGRAVRDPSARRQHGSGCRSRRSSPTDLAVGRHIIGGHYEGEVAAVFRSVLRPGMGVLDVGANIGYFTMLSASLVGPGGYVLSVEPNPDNTRMIEASRVLNGFDHVTVLQAAAGRTTGLLALNTSHSNGTTSAIKASSASILGARTVPCLALDSVLPAGTEVGLIKVDVEGAEYNALLGCQDVIRRHRPVIVSEFSPGLLAGISGIPGEAYLRWLLDLGYDLAVIEPDGTRSPVGEDVDSVMAAYHARMADHIDIVATPNRSGARSGWVRMRERFGRPPTARTP